MHHGWIRKGIGSFYTVVSDGAEYVCKARGRFRNEGLTPVPGDGVEFELGEDGGGYLLAIEPRRNLLIRPAVANLDKLMIVLAASRPVPDLLLVDKLLLQCETLGILPVIVCNKCDEQDALLYADLLAQYRPAGYAVLGVSAKTGEGIERVRAQIAGSKCCFAGQSAVGKSSLLNALVPELALQVGGLSRKTERGRHTTRHAELYPVCGGAVLDTPGFSLLDIQAMEPNTLAGYYPEMRRHTAQCRFAACLHVSEPECAVKPLITSGALHPQRYARYVELLTELKEIRRHKYD